jgi:putative oxidoreductase
MENDPLFRRMLRTHAPAAVILIRFLAGGVFFIEGLKKFLFADQWGAGRFVKIGIPIPSFSGPFVGVVEIVCGVLLLLGLLTRLGALVLLINISVAIATTKIPILLKSGFFAMEDPARTDYSMFMSLLFLAIVGAGRWSLDSVLWNRPLQRCEEGQAPGTLGGHRGLALGHHVATGVKHSISLGRVELGIQQGAHQGDAAAAVAPDRGGEANNAHGDLRGQPFPLGGG